MKLHKISISLMSLLFLAGNSVFASTLMSSSSVGVNKADLRQQLKPGEINFPPSSINNNASAIGNTSSQQAHPFTRPSTGLDGEMKFPSSAIKAP